jgi:hypothetical protein
MSLFWRQNHKATSATRALLCHSCYRQEGQEDTEEKERRKEGPLLPRGPGSKLS